MEKIICREVLIMSQFFNDDFLLKTQPAKELFHKYAKDMPIFDFHCHLDPKAIYENQNFVDITHAWLGGDHYKWRIMRGAGIEEKYITGNASSYEKFLAFAKSLKYAVGSPVYHWAHMELRTFFGINDPLTEDNAKQIFGDVNEKLKQKDFSLRRFIEKSNVTSIFTTDDPADNLEWHEKIKNDPDIKFSVLPAFRPDKLINVQKAGFAEYIGFLGESDQIAIHTMTQLEGVLLDRLKHFVKMGCVASDHGLDYIPFENCTRKEAGDVLRKALAGEELTKLDIDRYQTHLLKFLALQYKKLGWVMEIHYGAIRNVNTSGLKNLGPDTGYDSIGETQSIENLAKLFDHVQVHGGMPKTMVFNINPNDNYLVGTLIGGFQDTGSMQFGTAWWFNDHINGMTAQINALADVGVLGKFVGMLTDSRSFLSYPRHDYFRRILCNIVGQWIEDGLYNPDLAVAGEIIQDICYNNAVEYFKLKL